MPYGAQRAVSKHRMLEVKFKKFLHDQQKLLDKHREVLNFTWCFDYPTSLFYKAK
jgi:hypothetical protein